MNVASFRVFRNLRKSSPVSNSLLYRSLQRDGSIITAIILFFVLPLFIHLFIYLKVWK